MATDTIFVGTGDGGSAETGIVGWGLLASSPALFPVPLQIGVWGLGSQHGVLGAIDDGSFSPGISVLLTGASYTLSSGILGAAPTNTGVAGVSTSSVGVFGQAGTFAASLPSGLSCGVLGTATNQAGVMGFSDTSPGVSGTSTVGEGVFGTSATTFGVTGRFGSTGVRLVDPQHPTPKPDSPPVSAGVFGTGVNAIGVGGTSLTSIGVLGQRAPRRPRSIAR